MRLGWKRGFSFVSKLPQEFRDLTQYQRANTEAGTGNWLKCRDWLQESYNILHSVQQATTTREAAWTLFKYISFLCSDCAV